MNKPIGYGWGQLRLAVLDELRRQPWQSVTRIAHVLHVSPPGVCRVLRKMYAAEEVQQDRQSRYALCGPLPGEVAKEPRRPG